MKILLSVFNNLYTDQRVEKICQTLHENGHQIELIGNSWGGLPEMKRPYKFHRISLNSKNLKTAYPEFNFKLYRYLLEHADTNSVLVANDLDTLWANYLVSKKLNIPVVYDSHEIFTEMPSVQARFVQKIWRFLENRIIRKLPFMMTASESYADWFVQRYQIKKPLVIQNFPRKLQEFPFSENHPKIILYQGAINPSRGLDKLIPVMQKIPNAELWIAGKGPKLSEYQKFVQELQFEDKIKFLGNLLPEKLREITRKADVGISIEENNGLSYFYSLPNKISDYIQARVPVVVSAFPEMKKIVEKYAVGNTIENHSEEELAEKINAVLHNGKAFYKNALNSAASELCWENEEEKLLAFYQKIQEVHFGK